MGSDIIARGLGGKALKEAVRANQRIDLLPRGLTYRGAVNYLADLDNLAAEDGDVYTVKYKGSSGTTPYGAEYVYGSYEGSKTWVELGQDFSDAIAALQSGKQDKLTATEGISLVGAEIGIDFNLVATVGYVNEKVGEKQDTLDENSEVEVKTLTIGGHTLDSAKLEKLLDLLDATLFEVTPEEE